MSQILIELIVTYYMTFILRNQSIVKLLKKFEVSQDRKYFPVDLFYSFKKKKKLTIVLIYLKIYCASSIFYY